MGIQFIAKTQIQSTMSCCTTLVTRETNAFEAIDALSSFVIKPANPWLTKRRSAFPCDLKLKFMIAPIASCWVRLMRLMVMVLIRPGQAKQPSRAGPVRLGHRAQVSQHGAVELPLCVETFAAIWL